ncbi:MAG: fibronectin type III domain-containing protein [Eubacterium sp.]|nr:fibronectin type III domain-containing protein [Eubacterium sp.]
MKNRLFKSVLSLAVASSLIFTGTGVSTVYADETTEESGISEETIEYVEENAGLGDTSDSYIPTEASDKAPEVEENTSIVLGASEGSSLSSYSSIDNGYVPSARNQGDYNTCWAFSTLGIVETSLIRQGFTSKSVNLSELQLSYFTYNQVDDPLGNCSDDYATITGSNWKDFGGTIEWALNTIFAGKGIADESTSALSYSKMSSTSTLSDSYAYDYDYADIEDVYYLSISSNPDLVKQAIYDYGSVSVAYHAPETNAELSKYYNSSNNAYYAYSSSSHGPGGGSSTVSANHAVTIVGWDDDFSASNFNKTPSGDGAWLIRNSWSDSDGYNVYCYFWLSYYDVSIDDTVYAIDATLSSSADYDNIYQYDGGIYTWHSGYSTAANVFTSSASDYERLNSVVVSATYDANVDYTISIYTDLDDTSDPESGVLRSTQTGTFEYAGIYTVDLDDPVLMAKGTTYSVVVSLSGSTYGIDCEYETKTYSDNSIYVLSNVDKSSGESFVYTSDGWTDYNSTSSNIGNIRIKAYTENISEDDITVEQVTDVTATPTSAVKIQVSWPSVSLATGYIIYYKAKGEDSWESKTLTATSGTCIYTLTGLSKGTKYNIKVCALVGEKTGDVSSVITSLTKPGKVVATKKSVTSSSVTLTWDKTTGATGYIVYRATSKSGTYKKIKTIKGASNVTYTNTGLSSGKKYYYKVVAYTKYKGTIYYGVGAKVGVKTK